MEMLRKTDGRLGGAIAIVLLALAVLAALPSTGATAADSDSVTVQGVEHDARLGRAWLLARLPSDGYLRMTSTGVKAFAPPRELDAGSVRIPLVPKLFLAKRLRLDGSALVPVTIYFRPQGKAKVQTVQRAVTMVRHARARSGAAAASHH